MEIEKKLKRLAVYIVLFSVLSALSLAVLLFQLLRAEWKIMAIQPLWLFFLLLLVFGLALMSVSLCASRRAVLKYDLEHSVRCENCGMECFDNHCYCPACGTKLKKEENA